MIDPLDVLYEAPGLPAFDLPDELATLYGGTLGLAEPRLYANFVATADGVVAIPSIPSSNKLIAGGSAADRFVMGLLRACADALVIGSGTLTASPRSVWTAEQAFPDLAEPFAELRRRIGRTAGPETVVLSASGTVDPAHPALEAGALIVTTDDGAARLAGRLPAAATAISIGAGPTLDPAATVALLGNRGHRLILSEGGPNAIGPFLAAGLVDELFLTVSPVLAGRLASPRPGLVDGVELLPGTRVAPALRSLRRGGDHLFARYAFR